MGIWIQTANYCISVSKINQSINIFFKCVNLNVQSIGISRTIEVITFVFLFRQSTTCVHSFTSASTCAWSCYVTSLVILHHHRIAFPELTPELANVVVKEIQWTSLCPCETGGGKVSYLLPVRRRFTSRAVFVNLSLMNIIGRSTLRMIINHCNEHFIIFVRSIH